MDNKMNGEEGNVVMVRDMIPDEKPRERALKYGIGSLSTVDLFAIILRVGAQGYPITQLCRDMLKANDNKLLNLERRSLAELCKIKGLGPAKGLQVAAVMEIVRRYSHEKLGERVVITDSTVLYELMRPEIGNLSHEEMWAILLNRKNEVIGRVCLTRGGTTATVFDLKMMLREALLNGAEGVAICHNHPSGNRRPSGQDDNVTRRFKDGCKMMDLTCLDHLIITTDGYYSYRDESSII